LAGVFAGLFTFWGVAGGASVIPRAARDLASASTASFTSCSIAGAGCGAGGVTDSNFPWGLGGAAGVPAPDPTRRRIASRPRSGVVVLTGVAPLLG